jgi:hypothetical protein
VHAADTRASCREAVTALAEELKNDRFPGAKHAPLCAQLAEVAADVDSKLKKEEARRAKQERLKLELDSSRLVWCAACSGGRPGSALRARVGARDKASAAVLLP